MSQLSHSVGVVPLVMLEVGGVKKMKREHRGVFNSPGPAGQQIVAMSNIMFLPLCNET